jgi:hypothetical protein
VSAENQNHFINPANDELIVDVGNGDLLDLDERRPDVPRPELTPGMYEGLEPVPPPPRTAEWLGALYPEMSYDRAKELARKDTERRKSGLLGRISLAGS